MPSPYREFIGDQWLDRPLRLPGGTLRLLPEKFFRSREAMAHMRAGRKAKVYRTQRNGREMAMKVFMRSFARFENLFTTGQLVRFRGVAGLSVCDRVAIDEAEATSLGAPGLAYAVLMPWVDGEAWVDIIDKKRPLPQETCLALARHTSEVLAGLERRQLVHTDISSSNVFVDRLGPSPVVELIDVEDMFHPSFMDITDVSDGTPGYSHPRNAGRGCWNAYGDRFAASILLAEMTTWHDGAIRVLAESDSVFGQPELCTDSAKFRLVRDTLSRHSPAAADLFERAWRSSGLSECPTLAEWWAALASARTATTAWPAHGAPLPQVPFLPAFGRVGGRTGSQTTLVSGHFCIECAKWVRGQSPSDHASTCSHHPSQFTPEFDPSRWLGSQSKPLMNPALRSLLKQHSSRFTFCDACHNIVTGPDDDAHAADCPKHWPASTPPTPSWLPAKPAARTDLPSHDDVTFMPFIRQTPGGGTPRRGTPSQGLPGRSGLSGLPSAGRAGTGGTANTTCPECGGTITRNGTTEWGHRFSCSKHVIRQFFRNL